MIRTSYDPDADVMQIKFGGTKAAYDGVEEVAPGVFLEFDTEGEAIGVEITSVSLRGEKKLLVGAQAAE